MTRKQVHHWRNTERLEAQDEGDTEHALDCKSIVKSNIERDKHAGTAASIRRTKHEAERLTATLAERGYGVRFLPVDNVDRRLQSNACVRKIGAFFPGAAQDER